MAGCPTPATPGAAIAGTLILHSAVYSMQFPHRYNGNKSQQAIKTASISHGYVCRRKTHMAKIQEPVKHRQPKFKLMSDFAHGIRNYFTDQNRRGNQYISAGRPCAMVAIHVLRNDRFIFQLIYSQQSIQSMTHTEVDFD